MQKLERNLHAVGKRRHHGDTPSYYLSGPLLPILSLPNLVGITRWALAIVTHENPCALYSWAVLVILNSLFRCLATCLIVTAFAITVWNEMSIKYYPRIPIPTLASATPLGDTISRSMNHGSMNHGLLIYHLI